MYHIPEIDLKDILDKTRQILCENLFNGCNIFITGSTGFFGKWFLEYLLYSNKKLKLNFNIYALSRDPEKFLDQFPFFKNEKCIRWVKGDIKTFIFPNEEIDFIIHAATESDANLYLENPLLMIDTITEGTRRVLELARIQPKLKAFLLTSSGAVYGKQPENIKRIKEADSFFLDINNPNSSYAEGKRIAELYCAIYAKQYNVPVKIARCFAFVGPYLPLEKHFAIGNFILKGLQNSNIEIKGDGTPLRSYLYASDLIIWLIKILFKGKINRPYNVGSEEEISIRELAEIVNRVLGNSLLIEVKGEKNDKRPKDIYIPNTLRCQKELSLCQYTDLQNSIIKTYEFYRALKNK